MALLNWLFYSANAHYFRFRLLSRCLSSMALAAVSIYS